MIKNSNTPKEERDSWRTPKYLFRYANDIVGGFDYDTACTEHNCLATPVWAGNEDQNALTATWSGKLWCNPPYSDIKPWITKSIESGVTVVMLIPSPNGESYYEDLILNSLEISIIGRIAFINAEGKAIGGNTRGSSLFIINDERKGQRIIVRRDDLIKAYK